jgi:hypothetical protein
LPALKNKNLRGPGPQAFGFLTNSRAVIRRLCWLFSTHHAKLVKQEMGEEEMALDFVAGRKKYRPCQICPSIVQIYITHT